MKKTELKKILATFYKTPTVNAIVRGDRKPSYEIILKLYTDFKIPFIVWKDIKSFINESLSEDENKNKYRKEA